LAKATYGWAALLKKGKNSWETLCLRHEPRQDGKKEKGKSRKGPIFPRSARISWGQVREAFESSDLQANEKNSNHSTVTTHYQALSNTYRWRRRRVIKMHKTGPQRKYGAARARN